jgi:hypothetical protein
MSAIPPKAEVAIHGVDVRYVPTRDIRGCLNSRCNVAHRDAGEGAVRSILSRPWHQPHTPKSSFH